MTESKEKSITITSKTQELGAVMEKFIKASSTLVDQFVRDMTGLRHSSVSEVASILADEPQLDIREA